MDKLNLLKRLAPYVCGDDVKLSRLEFLRYVADRINDDIAEVYAQAELFAAAGGTSNPRNPAKRG